jgi:hypothetical protein
VLRRPRAGGFQWRGFTDSTQPPASGANRRSGVLGAMGAGSSPIIWRSARISVVLNTSKI